MMGLVKVLTGQGRLLKDMISKVISKEAYGEDIIFQENETACLKAWWWIGVHVR